MINNAIVTFEKAEIPFTTIKEVKQKLVSKIEQANCMIKYEIEIQKGLKTVKFFYTSTGKETTEQ